MEHRPLLLSFRGITRTLRYADPSEWISYLSPRIAMHACESLAVKEAMVRSGVPEEKCRVIYNVALDMNLDSPADAWRERWGIAPGTRVIGTVAAVRPIKGIDVLLRAAMRLTDVPDWRLVIVGSVEDPEVACLAALPELKGRVVLAGFSDDAPSAMQAMDLFVMPSRSEGLCRALIEAMMLGVCPIVSAAGGMKELVRHQQDGLVVPIEDDETLALAMRTLLDNSDLRNRYALSAKERVRNLCTPAAVVDALERMYATVTHPDWNTEND